MGKGGSERQGDLPKDTQLTTEPGLKDFQVPSPKLIMSGVSTPSADAHPFLRESM